MYNHDWARSVVAKTMLCARAQQIDTEFDYWCLETRDSCTAALEKLLCRALERSQDDTQAKLTWYHWQKLLRHPGIESVDTREGFYRAIVRFEPTSDKPYVSREIPELDKDPNLVLEF